MLSVIISPLPADLACCQVLESQSNSTFFTGKAGFEIANGHYIGGGLGVASANTFEDVLPIGYANYTHSFHTGNLTGGITIFSIEEDIGTYALYFGRDYRLILRISFVTENFVFPEAGDEPVLSYDLRFMGQNISFDLAFFRPALGTDIWVWHSICRFCLQFLINRVGR